MYTFNNDKGGVKQHSDNGFLGLRGKPDQAREEIWMDVKLVNILVL